MLVLTLLEGPRAGQRVELRGPWCRIGRSPANELCLPEADHISGRHAELRLEGGRWYLEDLGSTNGSAVLRADGTEVASRPGSPPVPLRPGDELLLGDPEMPVRVGVTLADQAAGPSPHTALTRLVQPEIGVERIAADAPLSRSFQRFVTRLLRELDPAALGRTLAELLLERFSPLHHVAVFAPGAEAPEVLVHRAGREPRGAFPFSRSLLARVAQADAPVLFRDVAEEAAPDGTVAALRLSSGFGVPLRGAGGEDAGLLLADARADDPGPPQTGNLSVDDLAVAAVFAENAGRVLHAARERERAEDAVRRLQTENRRMAASAEAIAAAEGMIGRHPAFLEALARVERVAGFPTPVLIRGETGVGKEGLARAVHRLSDRKERAFVAVNSAAIPRDLLESQLFGYVKGAFTGAERDTPGLFEEADGGTLFLDELGELPAELQAKLLRVLQEGEFYRVGARAPSKVDVRIVAATHRDLQEEVRRGRFREDLLYRLDVFPVELPALRDRRTDIPLLARHFAKDYGLRFGRGELNLSPAALRRLEGEPWPGNVRELQNRVQRAVILCDGHRIEVEDVAPPGEAAVEVDDGPPRGGAMLAPDGTILPLRRARTAFQRLHVLEALRQADGVQKRAAELLGLDPGNLSRLMRDLGLR